MPEAEELAAVPAGLRDRAQWVCWRIERRGDGETKVPIDPSGGYASTTDPETWSDFAAARDRAEGDGVAGVGFVFRDADPFVGVDLDDCRDADSGEPDAWAENVIDELDSYTEVSPSGTGFHVILEATIPGARNREGDLEATLSDVLNTNAELERELEAERQRRETLEAELETVEESSFLGWWRNRRG